MDETNEMYFDLLDEVQDKQEPSEKVTCCSERDNYQEHEGMIMCKICGNTISNIIESPEWKFYGGDSRGADKNRCGMPTNDLLPKSSLGSSISTRGGNTKLGMYQRWNSMPYKERSLYKVFNEIDCKCLKNNLPKIIASTAKSLYRVISETKIKRGLNRKGIIAACVYNACKECGVPRTINELSEVFSIDPKTMTKGCKNYTETMRMSKMDISRIQNTKSIDLSDFIERFCHNLGIDDKPLQVIQHISEMCQEFHLVSDNTPSSMASGCIYLYVKLYQIDVSKKDIANVCKISEVTVNKCYKKIEKHEIIMDFMKSIREDES